MKGTAGCTICFQFITINSLYMFQALICSSSGGTVYHFHSNPASSQPTKHAQFVVYTVHPDDGQISAGNM
jgi:hypothetical protein